MTKILIQGTLKAVAPIHVAHAHVKGEIDDMGRPRRTSGSNQCTMTYKVPMPLPAELVGSNGNSRMIADVPTLPGTSLRRKIRNAAAALIKQHFIDKKVTLSARAYRVLQCGAYAGNAIDTTALRPDDIQRANDHLFAGIFGGGPSIFQSKLVTPDCYAHCEETHILGVQPEDLPGIRLLQAYMLTYAHPFIRKDDFLDLLDPLAPSVIENYAEEFAQWQAAVLENKSARDDVRKRKIEQKQAAAKAREDKAAGIASEASSAPASNPTADPKKIMLKSQSAVEAVMPGVMFGYSASAYGSDAQCGLVLRGIAGMFELNEFGGMIRNGYGRVAAQLTLSVNDGPRVPFLTSTGLYGAAPQVEPAAQPFFEALQVELDKLTPASFDEVYRLSAANDGVADEAA